LFNYCHTQIKEIAMLTIKAEIKKDGLRKDKTYNVKIRFTLHRQTRRLSTNLFARPSDLNRKKEIKQETPLYKDVCKLLFHYEDKCKEMEIEKNHYSVREIVDRLKNKDKGTHIDFIKFSREWIANATIKGAANYAIAVNSFVRFLGKDSLDIREITVKLLRKYIEHLNKRKQAKDERLRAEGKRVPSNRVVSLYVGSLRHLFKEAQLEYNDYDEGHMPIPYSPFDRITIPRQGLTRKRALTVEQIKAIYTSPYKNEEKGPKKTCRHDLAKDCFILSFCLMGMNSVDLYDITELRGDTLIYNRAKTKDRRLDHARMEVRIPSFLSSLVFKYKDLTGKRVFNFHETYADRAAFNKAINSGLKEIGEELGIDDLQFYAARHSWATIAVNKVGIDKYTVHSSLNHVDESMRVTDIYIERDFVLENKANERVMSHVFGDVLCPSLDFLTDNVSRSFIAYGGVKFA